MATCPRDAGALGWHEANRLKCRQCETCKGIFVDRNALIGLLPTTDPSKSLQALPDSGLACCGCGQSLRKLVHRGAEVDVCAACRGVWLDAGEWERIAKPSSRGSQFGRTAVMAGAAAAAGGAAAVAAASAKSAASLPPAGQESLVSQVGSGIADVVGDVAVEGAIEVVFSFVGDAIGSLF
jgi:Zn-finger nucleic acid-binding protein